MNRGKTFVVYDNSIMSCEVIQDIIGEKGFGDVIVKRKRIYDLFCEPMRDILPNAEICNINNVMDMELLYRKFETMLDEENIHIIHWHSNFLINDIPKIIQTIQKVEFAKTSYILKKGIVSVGFVFSGAKEYMKYFMEMRNKEVSKGYGGRDIDSVQISGVIDIGVISNFIQCITGNFDSRYFNSLEGDEYTIVKKSSSKRKIKAEYMFYHLLPDDMKSWFVLPYDYKETETYASYTMERLHITDLAIKWVHGAIDLDEFNSLMDKYFHFFNSRHQKNLSIEEYRRIEQKLYVDKIKDRISELKALEEYSAIEKMIQSGTSFKSIDDILAWYLQLYNEYTSKISNENCVSVIGHGDPCFSNVLYNKSTQTLKLIDPKGALEESELWTNPYYDIAKLSHSVCGLYDFFNNGQYEINLNENFEFSLNIDFDNSGYKELFKRKVEENGFDYVKVRLYEASLFISMLPLHMDFPYKVFGFILNAVNILKEVERYVK